jgi:hypothetical protein
MALLRKTLSQFFTFLLPIKYDARVHLSPLLQ